MLFLHRQVPIVRQSQALQSVEKVTHQDVVLEIMSFVMLVLPYRYQIRNQDVDTVHKAVPDHFYALLLIQLVVAFVVLDLVEIVSVCL